MKIYEKSMGLGLKRLDCSAGSLQDVGHVAGWGLLNGQNQHLQEIERRTQCYTEVSEDLSL